MENRDQFLKQVEKRLTYKEFPPQIIIETTAFCNIKCAHCGHSTMKRKKGRMDIKLFKKIIDEIAENAPETEVWMTFYGEALMLKYKLFYMIKYAKEKGLKYIILNTNGMLLDDEMQDLILESGLDRFIFSIDGYTAETFEKIRVLAKRETVYSNILSLIKKMKDRNLVKPYLEVQFSVMDENEHELEDFKKFWFEQGVYIKTREKLTWGGTVEASNLDRFQDRIACPWAMANCAIIWTGEMVACTIDYKGQFVSGNVKEDTIKNIWNGKHKDFVQLHIDHKFDQLPQFCQECLDWQAVGAETYDKDTREPISWKEIMFPKCENKCF